MKQFYQVFYGLFVLLLSACSNEPGKNESQIVGDNKTQPVGDITDNHVRVPNSNLYIIPPAGFVAETSSGTIRKHSEDDYSANFLVMKFLSGYTNEKYLAELKTESEKKYPGVWKEEKVEINGHAATICKHKTMEMVTGYHVYFTDGYTDETLAAFYDDKDEQTGNEMNKALKTLVAKK